MAQWPSPGYGGGSLPDYVYGGATRDTEDDGTTEQPFDVGPPQKFRHSTIRKEGLTFTLTHMTDDQVREIHAFHDATLIGGVDPFDWRLPEDPSGPLVSFQFRERPHATWVSRNNWNIRVNIRIMPS